MEKIHQKIRKHTPTLGEKSLTSNVFLHLPFLSFSANFIQKHYLHFTMKFIFKKGLGIYAVFLFVMLSSVGYSQVPGLQWQRSLGGSGDDAASFSFLTTDGGIIIVGSTLSNNGITSDNHGGEDVWIMKLAKNGSLEWSKCFGGSGTDEPIDAVFKNEILTIAANSNSTNGNITNNHGNSDFWVFQIDGSGNMIWQRSFGGSGNDYCSSLTSFSTGGFAISGRTRSNDADVVGQHGAEDLWIIYVSDSGVLQWQKTLGGTNLDGFNARIIESNGSFLVSTETYSNNGDVIGFNGGSDIWIVNLSSTGAIQWQKCLGAGSFEYNTDLKIASNGDIFVLGRASSSALPGAHSPNNGYFDVYLCQLSPAGILIQQKCFGGSLDDSPVQLMILPDGILFQAVVNNQSGDVSGVHGGNEIWMVKLKPDFTIEWQRPLGGSGNEGTAPGEFTFKPATGKFIQTNDGNFLISGYTDSPNSGDVTGYHPNPNISDTARADLWIVKLSNSGQLQWQRTYGGTRGDYPRSGPMEISPNEFIITAYTNSTDYHVTGNKGSYDAWILKIGAVNMIKGTLFIDNNLNGVKDLDEPYYSDAIVHSKKNNDSVSAVPYNGLFANEVDTGNYLTSLTLNKPYYTILPTSVSSSFSSYFSTDSFSFALQPVPNKQDLSISLMPLTLPRPGFNASYLILYKNAGTTTITSGEILFKKDSRVSFLSASPGISGSNGDTLKWSYTNFNPGDTASILLNLQVSPPPTVNINDSLSFIAIIIPVSGDETPSDDTAFVKQIVRGSYDPNDKNENNGGTITQAYVNSGKYLNYLIRFQNTGTDTAFNVVIRDTLDNKLNWNTLEMVAASHPYLVNIADQDKIAWTFPDIHLPDSNINEPASHGFVAYRIKPNLGLSPGDVIANSASIYFDFNLPIVTNTVLTEVTGNQALPLTLLDFKGVYRNDITELYWSTTNEYNVQKFEIERSFNGTSYSVIGVKKALNANSGITDYTFTDDLRNIANQSLFYYRLKMVDIDGKTVYSNVILVRRDQQLLRQIQILPNPVSSTSAQVLIPSSANVKGIIRVMDLSGHVLLQQTERLYPGTNSVLIRDLSKLSGGTYILEVIWDGHSNTKKFIIQ